MVPSEEAPLDILAGLFSDMSAYTLPGNTQLSNESLAVAFEALANTLARHRASSYVITNRELSSSPRSATLWKSDDEKVHVRLLYTLEARRWSTTAYGVFSGGSTVRHTSRELVNQLRGFAQQRGRKTEEPQMVLFGALEGATHLLVDKLTEYAKRQSEIGALLANTRILQAKAVLLTRLPDACAAMEASS